jgi:DHA1 family bicyclomycin/chloramphenicol resistance-like MFS transporter
LTEVPESRAGYRETRPARIEPKSFVFTVLLGLYAALPALSVDISAPTLALLPGALGTTRTVAGLTLSLFMVGFAFGQLGAGRISDRRGRRPMLLAGLTCFSVSGIACALSWSGGMLVLFRLIQGFGAGACFVISFAMIQDLFEGDAARAKRSYVTVIFGALPILAPALGAVLIGWFGWRSVHWLLALAGAVLLAVTWAGVAESRTQESATSSQIGESDRVPLWKDATFVRITIANALSYGAIFAYIAGSPVVIIGIMGLSTAVFASVFASTAAALSMGAWTSGLLSRRGATASALVNPSLIVAAGASLALAATSMSGITSGIILIPLLLGVLFTRGIIAPNLQHLAIERQRERAGSASAAVGVSQLLSGALASAAVAVLLQSFGPGSVAVVMALLAIGALGTWRWTGSRGEDR